MHAIVAWKVIGDVIFIRNPGSAASGLPNGSNIDSLTLDNYVVYVNGSGIAAGDQLDSNYQFLLAGGTYTYASAITNSTATTARGAAHSPVEFVITDPLGRRLGFNPTIALSYREIPDSIYDRIPFVVSPDGTLTAIPGVTAPIDFEIGTLVDGSYALDVYGIGTGDWSINLGLNGSNGFDPNQYLFSGVASPTSHEQFSFSVPEPSALLLSVFGFGVLLSNRRTRTNST